MLRTSSCSPFGLSAGGFRPSRSPPRSHAPPSSTRHDRHLDTPPPLRPSACPTASRTPRPDAPLWTTHSDDPSAIHVTLLFIAPLSLSRPSLRFSSRLPRSLSLVPRMLVLGARTRSPRILPFVPPSSRSAHPGSFVTLYDAQQVHWRLETRRTRLVDSSAQGSRGGPSGPRRRRGRCENGRRSSWVDGSPSHWSIYERSSECRADRRVSKARRTDRAPWRLLAPALAA